MIQTINPATEAPIQSYTLLSKQESEACVEHAFTRYQSWRNTSWQERKQGLLNLAVCLRKDSERYAELMAREMGKPLKAGRSEIEKCAWVCEYYAEHGEAYLATEYVDTNLKRSKICYQPMGVVFAIMPWNFPFWQVFRYAAPTIFAGNTTLLKHAPISTGTAEAITALFLEAGFPPHVFQHVVVDNDVAANIIAHDAVIGVTFTGSAHAGSQIAACAGQYLKRVVLELGGCDPAVVLEDADVELAARVIVDSRLNNTGQVCIAAKRIIAVKSVMKSLLEAIRVRINDYPVGDPLDDATVLGPMARADLRDTLHQQVLLSIEKGAMCLLGGVLPAQPGFYYPPTILTDVAPGMPAFDDELFGPVIALIEAEDEADAIRLANQTEYGLGASVFTRDEAHGEMIATDKLEAGTCFVNGRVTSDPRLPFGGIKHSGLGRELAREGILAFVNMKTVGVAHG
ncbi:MAG: NAD-dependent succinate-semialdehyde dehydrogenase [Legionellaceae bacterium]|nr:NAD-dependent succinate-semialdehyde dehydrogenase [Legionellaceae bacterium]